MQQNRQWVMVKVPEGLGDDRVAARYEQLLKDLDWSQIAEIDDGQARRGRLPHPERAYVGAFVVMVEEKLTTVSALRRYLGEHPALVWLLEWQVVPDEQSVYGFDVQRSVPVDGHLRAKLRTLGMGAVNALLAGTLQVAQTLMGELSQSAVLDVKHIYAPVKENNPRQYVAARYNPYRQPRGDRDCRLGSNAAPTVTRRRPTPSTSGAMARVLPWPQPPMGKPWCCRISPNPSTKTM